MKVSSRFVAVPTLLLVLVLAGCTATLNHGDLGPQADDPRGEIAVVSQVENLPRPLGWGTITLFAIPVAPLTIAKGDGERKVMLQIRDAVAHAGYQPVDVATAADAGSLPVFQCRVKSFRFRNYTYFFPIVFNWGKIALDASVQDPAGNVLWSKSYSEGSMGGYGFSGPVNRAMTKILKKLSADLAAAGVGAAPRSPLALAPAEATPR